MFTETAVNIGYSCRLLTDFMREVFIIDADDEDKVEDQLNEAVTMINNPSTELNPQNGYSRCCKNINDITLL